MNFYRKYKGNTKEIRGARNAPRKIWGWEPSPLQKTLEQMQIPRCQPRTGTRRQRRAWSHTPPVVRHNAQTSRAQGSHTCLEYLPLATARDSLGPRRIRALVAASAFAVATEAIRDAFVRDGVPAPARFVVISFLDPSYHPTAVRLFEANPSLRTPGPAESTSGAVP